jgi:hypothetical protein
VKITKSKLKQIIKEELQKTLNVASIREGNFVPPLPPTNAQMAAAKKAQTGPKWAEEQRQRDERYRNAEAYALEKKGMKYGYDPYEWKDGKWHADVGRVGENVVAGDVLEEFAWLMHLPSLQSEMANSNGLIAKIMELYKLDDINPFDMKDEEQVNLVKKLRPQIEFTPALNVREYFETN